MRPNLMSSSKRQASSDGKILASLEKGSGTNTVKSGIAPVSGVWRKSRNSLLFLLCVGLAWLTYDNATSVAKVPEPAVASTESRQAVPQITIVESKKPLPALVAPPEPAPAVATIKEEVVNLPPAVAAAVTAPSIPAMPVRLATTDKTKPAMRPTVAKKATKPSPAAAPDATPPDSDVAILSAIVAQGHAAKAAAGR